MLRMTVPARRPPFVQLERAGVNQYRYAEPCNPGYRPVARAPAPKKRLAPVAGRSDHTLPTLTASSRRTRPAPCPQSHLGGQLSQAASARSMTGCRWTAPSPKRRQSSGRTCGTTWSISPAASGTTAASLRRSERCRRRSESRGSSEEGGSWLGGCTAPRDRSHVSQRQPRSGLERLFDEQALSRGGSSSRRSSCMTRAAPRSTTFAPTSGTTTKASA